MRISTQLPGMHSDRSGRSRLLRKCSNADCAAAGSCDCYARRHSESLTRTVSRCANRPQQPKQLPPPLQKAALSSRPRSHNPLVIPKFEKPPVIDGKLDEEVWQKAVVLKDFYQIQPGDNTPPSRPTEVLLGFDPKFLYIAFKATDEPDKVRATVAKRDNIFQDDYVGFYARHLQRQAQSV